MSDTKSVLIARHGAYGDMIHMTHLPRLLKENGYDHVAVSTGKKGINILRYNPFIDKVHYAELADYTRHIGIFYYDTRLKEIARNYDKVINLNQSIEVAALPGQFQSEYFLDQKTRDLVGSENYYDISTRVAGFPELIGRYKGEIFFSDKENSVVEEYMEKYEGKFKVLINLSGSSPHKAFPQAKEVIDLILDKYENAVVFTTGDEACKDMDNPRAVSLIGKMPFRQVLCMCKKMDCVLGCESGMVCGSSCLGVPTIQLLTAASWNNHCKYAEKDYSIQSPCRCSPCHKNPYDYWGCPKRNEYPLCVYFTIDDIMERIGMIYAEKSHA